jgi:hypothetical protein
MSVIFQTLKKMRSHPPQGQDAAGPASDGRHGRSLPDLLLSPPVLVMALLAIGLAGYLVVFGFNHVKERIGGPQTVMPAPVSAQAAEPPVDPAQPFSQPSPAAVSSVAEAPDVPETADNPSLPGPGEPLAASYLPPQAAREIALQPADPPEAGRNRLPEHADDRGVGPPADRHRRPLDGASGVQPAGPLPAVALPRPVDITKGQERREDLDPVALVRQDPNRPAAAAPVAASSAKPAQPPAEDPAADSAESEFAPDRMRHRAAVEKNARIAGLIEATQAAIGRMDAEATRGLLDRLGRLEGPDCPYVLNLTAYWCLKQKDYPAAGRLLQQVLDQRPDDLEAGYNLALVEIHTQRPAEAYQRLARLREIHPDSAAVNELMRKLK